MQRHSIQISLQKAVKPFLVEQTKDDDDDSNDDENTNSNSNCDTDRCTGVCHNQRLVYYKLLFSYFLSLFIIDYLA